MNEMLDDMIEAAMVEAAELAEGGFHGPACTCGGGRHEERSMVETIPYGDDGRTFQVEVPVVFCLDCGNGFTDQRAERLRQAAYLRHVGLLTPEEVKSVRTGLGMTRREFDEAYGIPPASMDRWENGRLTQNRSMDTLLRALLNRATAARLDRRVVPQHTSNEDDKVVWGRFGRLAAATPDEQEDLLRRSGEFKLRAYA